jgi:diamine N-acetyltransferase
MTIRHATIADIPVIHHLAHEIWWPAYRDFISAEQISFMLAEMYSLEVLEQELKGGIDFLLAEYEKKYTGFAAYSLAEVNNSVFKLHKLYILPSEQGKGTGKNMIEHIADLLERKGGKILELNVNRSNPAFGFYKKIGFEVYKTVDIPYHEFVLSDYVMRKAL